MEEILTEELSVLWCAWGLGEKMQMHSYSMHHNTEAVLGNLESGIS